MTESAGRGACGEEITELDFRLWGLMTDRLLAADDSERGDMAARPGATRQLSARCSGGTNHKSGMASAPQGLWSCQEADLQTEQFNSSPTALGAQSKGRLTMGGWVREGSANGG